MRILAVSFAYPPLAYPRSIQVARLMKYCGFRTVLVCADEPGVRIDESIEPEAESFLEECIRVPVRESRMSQTVDRLSHRFARSIWIRRNLAPDRYGMWKSDVLATLNTYSRERRYKPDAIVTFAQPFTDHLIGLKLKELTGRPWIAHFSDPWVDNPFTPYDEPTRATNEKLEGLVARAADRLVFTSQETVELFLRKYPAELRKKTRVLPQCYDTDRYGTKRAEPDGIVTIRYLGNFYGHRKPTPLILALHQIAQTNPASLANVAIELVGSGDPNEVAELSSGLPENIVSTRDSVKYSESLRLMADSDGLLIIDAPADLSVFLPSKLIDYIGAGRPIFGITPPGAASSLISELGGMLADPGSIDEVAGKLQEFIIYLKERRCSVDTNNVWGRAEIRDRYRAETVVAGFRSILRELID
jgi:glycosyltransferase involved in cell wall biosynthesis